MRSSRSGGTCSAERRTPVALGDSWLTALPGGGRLARFAAAPPHEGGRPRREHKPRPGKEHEIVAPPRGGGRLVVVVVAGWLRRFPSVLLRLQRRPAALVCAPAARWQRRRPE